ncbi:MAG TPA: glycerophosphodiester phosphodiesterase family protein, partial [Nannocystis exedens]|nr:glycerophosphodiester phosphodiesterase family protein [Nannocystis exedens]
KSIECSVPFDSLEAVSTTANPFIVDKKKRPLVLGHRGVPLLHQENTMAGFRRCLDLGVDGIELDVMMTKDGQIVVFHDDTVDRLTGAQGCILDMTWDQVSKLRVRRQLVMGKDGKGGDVVMTYEQEERIPLLAEVLDEFAGKLAINVELKPAVPSWRQRRCGAAAAAVIREAGAETSLIVTSFDFFKLRALEAEHSVIHSGFAYDDDTVNYLPSWLAKIPEIGSEIGRRDDLNRNAETVVNALLEANVVGRWIGSSVVAGEHTLIEADTIEKFHDRDMAIGSYTFFPIEMTGVRHELSDEQQLGRLRTIAAAGVDWIETDDPVRVMELLS